MTEDATATGRTERAVFRTTIRGTMDQVWREITKTDEAQLAMFGAVMHRSGTAPGSRLSMRTKDGKYTSVIGEIVEWDPPRRFAHTIRFTQYDDPFCTVIYELEEAEGGVAFTLTVDNMPAGTKTEKSMRQGGPMICKVLKSVVERGKAPLGYRLLLGVFRLLTPIMTPAKCRSEHWEEWK